MFRVPPIDRRRLKPFYLFEGYPDSEKEKFDKFDKDNPRVWKLFIYKIEQAMNKGRKKLFCRQARRPARPQSRTHTRFFQPT